MQIIQKTLQLHITQKIVLQEVVDHQPSPHSEHKVIGVPIKGPQGLGGNHLLRLPNKGGCCPKRKKNHPPPRNNVGSGDPVPLTLQKGVHEELVFGVVSADPASVVGEGLGDPTIRVPFVNRPFEYEIHSTVNFTYFCYVLLVTWCHRVLLLCYLRPK